MSIPLGFMKMGKTVVSHENDVPFRKWGIPHPKVGNFPSDIGDFFLTKHSWP